MRLEKIYFLNEIILECIHNKVTTLKQIKYFLYILLYPVIVIYTLQLFCQNFPISISFIKKSSAMILTGKFFTFCHLSVQTCLNNIICHIQWHFLNDITHIFYRLDPEWKARWKIGGPQINENMSKGQWT